ncbi:UV DNA damage repair endonuclease UvsE [Bacillus sp. RG28]|uniref:UV DNA damage repair endonuclease UvsE n=1 Tax=Gottfriedia endophytica TaxID=2820819 RepID=A0A940NQR4_9BACI|nr:UV DNA damage repair endonuclease UvsE [Gottfriedia endophytica]MBP0727116.1 UV DNA damage repair endonuclease UvsE [Gottfriedia endophytica]
MLVRLGYVAMSVHLQNASPSQTMTFAQFKRTEDRNAALRKLERISLSNLENCLRLLKHNKAYDISFFRLSSKLIPLANHEELLDWDYLPPLKQSLGVIGDFVNKNQMRVDFHPDHFVILNSEDKDLLKASLKTLRMHYQLLKLMKQNPEHRCVLHVGGGYNDKEKALEQLIENFSVIPTSLQKMLLFENDDTTFTFDETLFVCEKLDVPVVFDYHHHLVHHTNESWTSNWERAVKTWRHSNLPMKMHISSQRDEKDIRAHADYIDTKQFLEFLNGINGSVDQIDCMIEAKKKDDALFRLMKDLKMESSVEIINGSSFYFKP